jgi:Tfp pilus assembly protein PilF
LTASVASFLTQAQKSGSQLPTALSGALLLAAIRLSEHRQQALRPYQLLVDDDGTLELLAGEPPTADGYAAPELRAAAALPHDPRVLVYAAGALGYELVTLTPPRLSGEAGPELGGPFASVIRKAMGERRDRFRSLKEMGLAVERVQARPTSDEERVILAAVASSTQLPPAQKLAKIELLRAAGAASSEPPPQAASFEPAWDGLEPSAEMDLPVQAPQPEPTPPALDEPQPSREAEEKVRQEDAAQAARLEELAKLQARVDELEHQVRFSPPPPPSPATALALEVKLLIDERRFAEAERALRSPLTAGDATLQLRLAQALASMPDADGSRAAQAEAAFRRAAELDPSWAQPKAGLGALLLRQGKREEALAQFRAALLQDPSCSEAQQALSQPRLARARRDYRLLLSAAIGAAAAASVLLFLRPAARATAVAHAPVDSARTPPTAPAPLTVPPPAPAAAPVTASAPEPARAPEPERGPAPARAPAREPEPARAPALARDPEPARAAEPAPRPRSRNLSAAHAAQSQAAKGDRALRAFDTRSAQSAFESALKLDPALPSAHRGMGMVYVLLGRNAEAKSEYAKYLKLAPDAPDKDQIERLLSR